MKKYLLVLLLTLGSLSQIKAQNGEKIQTLKIAFITQKLQLTPDEAEKFWPIYNQYDNEMELNQITIQTEVPYR
jgi:hypothetical protein